MVCRETISFGIFCYYCLLFALRGVSAIWLGTSQSRRGEPGTIPYILPLFLLYSDRACYRHGFTWDIFRKFDLNREAMRALSSSSINTTICIQHI